MNARDDTEASSEAAATEVGDDRFEGGDLCPACLAELTEGCGFCPKCAAPVSPTAAMAPFERIFAEGFIYRRAVAQPRKLIVVIGAWLVFLPLFLSGVIMVGWELIYGNTNAIYRLEGIFLAIIGGMGLYHVTRNYLNRPVPEPDSAAEN